MPDNYVVDQNDATVHYHKDEMGFLHRCYHRTRHWKSPTFIAGWLVATTLSFPIEHYVWLHTPYLDTIGRWIMGGG